MNAASLVLPVAALVLSPLLAGIVNRTKAIFAGRRGQPLFQLYHDLFKLFRKGTVTSRTTNWIFRAGPMVGLACAVTALLILPLGGVAAPLSFTGDMFFLAYLLGVMRFFTVIAALDTGSSFEGMGASREVQFSAIAEPVLLLGLFAVAQIAPLSCPPELAVRGGPLSLSGMFSVLSIGVWIHFGPALMMVAGALLVVFLAENSRIPVDDPNTHLELTMIHEVMVLDHGGPDFGMILYGAALKLWILGALLASVITPVRTGNPWLDGSVTVGVLFILAVVTGIIESVMARLRLHRVPQLLVGAGFLSLLALVMVLWS